MNHDFHDARARVLVCGVGAVGCEALEKVALSLGDAAATLWLDAEDVAGLPPSPLTVCIRLNAAAADDEALFLAGTCAQRDQMEDALRQADLLIVLADLGSAMGRGATKALFAIAGDHLFATVACVVLPEADHGAPRVASALAALDEIAHDVDAYLSVREGRIRDLPEDAPARTPGAVFAEAVCALARPILFPAAVPLDFADIMVFLKGSGRIAIGIGRASGENRAVEAAESAVAFPLLGRAALACAERTLLIVHGGSDLEMKELMALSTYVKTIITKDSRLLIGVELDDEPCPVVEFSILCAAGET